MFKGTQKLIICDNIRHGTFNPFQNVFDMHIHARSCMFMRYIYLFRDRKSDKIFVSSLEPNMKKIKHYLFINNKIKTKKI